ncbi:hypothetical protein CC77DRAFT_865403 [Alternaria alternata]|jgi:hypothetical protein|uniref:Uncharacterized protein n=1 Tax=Alternaria alternata TaxID=5599 RepID=A0A177DMV0_ALTAL|nr:hypothetical protein CC77DRAFT_865403 [Alternaria alternata]OAG21284.1 hypothetical protein CC77DRAFT_865403 [Alternaria alternata]
MAGMSGEMKLPSSENSCLADVDRDFGPLHCAARHASMIVEVTSHRQLEGIEGLIRWDKVVARATSGTGCCSYAPPSVIRSGRKFGRQRVKSTCPITWDSAQRPRVMGIERPAAAQLLEGAMVDRLRKSAVSRRNKQATGVFAVVRLFLAYKPRGPDSCTIDAPLARQRHMY